LQESEGDKVNKREMKQFLRLLGEKHAREGRSVNAFYDVPYIRHSEAERAEYEIGYRAQKREEK
jgi:hypothetical protein